MIVFPAIDLRKGRCVRLFQGRFDKETVYSDSPVAVAQRWIEEGATWLHLVNLDGALGEESPNARIIAEIAATASVPVQVGGGLRDLHAIELLVSLGADRVILGTAAVRQPELVSEAIRHFGAESVVIGIDSLGDKVATHGWRELSSVSALDLAKQMAERGVLRIVHTDIGRDGTLGGVNVQSCVDMAQQAGVKVIASGGVSGLEDIRRLAAVEEHGIEGVIIGQALYTQALSLSEAILVAAGRESELSDKER